MRTIKISANNTFHEGWLFGLLGLPRQTVDQQIMFDIWNDGYDMALATFETGEVLQAMSLQGQMIISVSE